MANLLAVFGIKQGNRHRAIPSGQNRFLKRALVPRFLSIVGEHRFVAGDEPPHKDEVTILIEIDADDVQALRRILPGEFVEQGILVAARLAPSGPEIDKQRLAVIALDYLLEALRVDNPRIVRSGGLPRGYGGKCRKIKQRNEHGAESHQQSSHDHSIWMRAS